MEFKLVCDCGKLHALTAADAGAKIPCTCGRAVSVPSLGKLRQQGLVPNQTHPVLAINRLLEAGELPLPGGCVRCGAEAEVVLVQAECERKWIRRRGGFSWSALIFSSLLLPLKIFHWEPVEVREFGRDVILNLPLRVCQHCRTEVRRQNALKTLLRHVPVYAQLLDRYPDAKVTVVSRAADAAI